MKHTFYPTIIVYDQIFKLGESPSRQWMGLGSPSQLDDLLANESVKAIAIYDLREARERAWTKQKK